MTSGRDANAKCLSLTERISFIGGGEKDGCQEGDVVKSFLIDSRVSKETRVRPLTLQTEELFSLKETVF